MTTYVIVDNEVKNQKEYQKYLELITPTVHRYSGRYLIRAGKIIYHDSEWAPKRLVVIAFDNESLASKWVNSEELSHIHAMRKKYSKSKLIIIEGVIDSITGE